MLPVVSATPIPMGICVAFVNSAAKLIKDPNISSGTGPVAPVGAYILGKQTTCKNAVPLNRVLMGVDLDVFSYSAVLISEFQANAYIAIVIHLDLLHEFN